MNENKRILLLALGILAIVASDPPVASYFERPHSACHIVTDLAVGAFDSLVRSTLPPSELREGQVGAEILVASDVSSLESADVGRSSSLPSSAASPSPASNPVVMTSARRVWVETQCSGRPRAVEMVRVEAMIQVRGASVQS